MATSGNTIKVLAQSQIINSALRKLGVLAEGGAANTAQVTTAQEALNIIVAEFRTLGMTIWAKETINVPLVTNQSTYVFGIGQAINVAYPIMLFDIQMQQFPITTSVQMNSYATIDFDRLPPASFGVPVNFNYQPGINVGTLKVWPTPDASVPAGSQMKITYQRPFQVFDAPANDADFPQEWGNALIYHLALALCDEFGVPDSKLARIEKLAMFHLGIASSSANEDGSLYIQRDWVGS